MVAYGEFMSFGTGLLLLTVATGSVWFNGLRTGRISKREGVIGFGSIALVLLSGALLLVADPSTTRVSPIQFGYLSNAWIVITAVVSLLLLIRGATVQIGRNTV